MIIEGAFFKLPELLIGNRIPGEQYEGTLVSQLAMAVLLELNARSVQQPLHRIHIERPYPSPEGQRPPGRANLFIDLTGVFPDSERDAYSSYGIKTYNWLEAKLFARIGERSGTETKTSNAGAIALDLIRLCLFVPEGTWGPHNNSRYFLLVSDRAVSEYVAFGRQPPNPPRREWLEALVSPGSQDFTITLRDEPRSFRSVFPTQDDISLQSLTARIRTTCTQFAPLKSHGPHSYFGFLIRIVGFRISSEATSLYYDEVDDPIWDETKSDNQRALSAKIRTTY